MVTARGAGAGPRSFPSRKGRSLRLPSVKATEAKNAFGRMLETALREGGIVITKHDLPKAVLLSWDEFEALASPPRIQLDTLAREFDSLLARMQTPNARRSMRRAFGATPEQLGMAAAAAARRSG